MTQLDSALRSEAGRDDNHNGPARSGPAEGDFARRFAIAHAFAIGMPAQALNVRDGFLSRGTSPSPTVLLLVNDHAAGDLALLDQAHGGVDFVELQFPAH